MKMKKLVTGVIVAAVLLTVGVMNVVAATNGRRGMGRCAAGTYADADGDGICDNRGTAGCAFTDADGDGICDTCSSCTDADKDGKCDGGSCTGNCGGTFTDADGDGICDNRNSGCTDGSCGNGARTGLQNGSGRGAGCGGCRL